MQSQMDCDDEDECRVGSSDKYDAAADLGFGSSKPGRHDKEGNPIMTIVDRSGVHEIGVSWCCCPEAPEHDMQLMMAGLFPATFHNPRQHLPSGCWKSSIWTILSARQLQASFSVVLGDSQMMSFQIQCRWEDLAYIWIDD
jgi:hypothetical protein